MVAELDEWIAGLFDPDAIEETCRDLAEVQGLADEDAAAAESARRKLVDCDGRLTRHRAAPRGGADPTVVTGWIAAVQGQRLAAEWASANRRC